MKKFLTFLLWFVLGLTLLCALLIAVGYVTYRFQTSRGEAAYPPPGQIAAVNGHRLHVSSEGERGSSTLVFLSGSGTIAPVLDFKRLCSRLSDETRSFKLRESDDDLYPHCRLSKNRYPQTSKRRMP